LPLRYEEGPIGARNYALKINKVSEKHIKKIKRILKYPKGYLNLRRESGGIC
jgi:hypothetical protein